MATQKPELNAKRSVNSRCRHHLSCDSCLPSCLLRSTSSFSLVTSCFPTSLGASSSHMSLSTASRHRPQYICATTIRKGRGTRFFARTHVQTRYLRLHVKLPRHQVLFSKHHTLLGLLHSGIKSLCGETPVRKSGQCDTHTGCQIK